MPTSEESNAIRKQTARVFFAIWPDNKTQKQLGGLVEQLQLEALCGGRKTKLENIHLTLVFLGEIDTDRLPALRHAADEVRNSGAGAFDFSIDEIGYWKHNHIVYLAPREVPAELAHLVSTLEYAVSAAGFSLERRPYAPHITLMRNARCPALSAFAPELPQPITWRAREWLLVKSEQTSGGSAYAPVGRWSLE
jgi:2'-5' RNA ligase